MILDQKRNVASAKSEVVTPSAAVTDSVQSKDGVANVTSNEEIGDAFDKDIKHIANKEGRDDGEVIPVMQTKLAENEKTKSTEGILEMNASQDVNDIEVEELMKSKKVNEVESKPTSHNRPDFAEAIYGNASESSEVNVEKDTWQVVSIREDSPDLDGQQQKDFQQQEDLPQFADSSYPLADKAYEDDSSHQPQSPHKSSAKWLVITDVNDYNINMSLSSHLESSQQPSDIEVMGNNTGAERGQQEALSSMEETNSEQPDNIVKSDLDIADNVVDEILIQETSEKVANEQVYSEVPTYNHSKTDNAIVKNIIGAEELYEETDVKQSDTILNESVYEKFPTDLPQESVDTLDKLSNDNATDSNNEQQGIANDELQNDLDVSHAAENQDYADIMHHLGTNEEIAYDLYDHGGDNSMELLEKSTANNVEVCYDEPPSEDFTACRNDIEAATSDNIYEELMNVVQMETDSLENSNLKSANCDGNVVLEDQPVEVVSNQIMHESHPSLSVDEEVTFVLINRPKPSQELEILNWEPADLHSSDSEDSNESDVENGHIEDNVARRAEQHNTDNVYPEVVEDIAEEIVIKTTVRRVESERTYENIPADNQNKPVHTDSAIVDDAKSLEKVPDDENVVYEDQPLETLSIQIVHESQHTPSSATADEEVTFAVINRPKPLQTLDNLNWEPVDSLQSDSEDSEVSDTEMGQKKDNFAREVERRNSDSIYPEIVEDVVEEIVIHKTVKRNESEPTYENIPANNQNEASGEKCLSEINSGVTHALNKHNDHDYKVQFEGDATDNDLMNHEDLSEKSMLTSENIYDELISVVQTEKDKQECDPLVVEIVDIEGKFVVAKEEEHFLEKELLVVNEDITEDQSVEEEPPTPPPTPIVINIINQSSQDPRELENSLFWVTAFDEAQSKPVTAEVNESLPAIIEKDKEVVVTEIVDMEEKTINNESSKIPANNYYVTEIVQLEGKTTYAADTHQLTEREAIIAEVIIITEEIEGKTIADGNAVLHKEINSLDIRLVQNDLVTEITDIEGKVNNSYVSELHIVTNGGHDLNSEASEEELFHKIESIVVENATTASTPTKTESELVRQEEKHWSLIESSHNADNLWRLVESVRSDYWSESPSKRDPSVDDSQLSLMSDEETENLFGQVERSLSTPVNIIESDHELTTEDFMTSEIKKDDANLAYAEPSWTSEKRFRDVPPVKLVDIYDEVDFESQHSNDVHLPECDPIQQQSRIFDEDDVVINEPPIRKQAVVREIVLPHFGDFDDENKNLESLVEENFEHKQVSLPNFAESSMHEVDLDDIGINKADTMSNEVMFQSRWKREIFHNISPYDNFGMKKVGKEEGPLYMLIPNTEKGVKIGNQ